MTSHATEARSRPEPGAHGAQSVTLVHFGDLHLWRIGLDFDFRFKRLLGLGNLMLRRGRLFPVEIARLVVARIAAEAADFICFSGDLTTTSLHREFLTARDLLTPLLTRWGPRFLSIPGNHDRYTIRATDRRFFEILFAGEQASYPYAVDLGANWTLVGIDTSVPRRLSSRGRITPEELDALSNLIERERARQRRIVVMGHYPLLYPPYIAAKPGHALPQRFELIDLLVRLGVELYIHGHKHNRWHLRHGRLALVNCGSAGMLGPNWDQRPGYARITLSASGAPVIESVTLAESASDLLDEDVSPSLADGDPAPADAASLPWRAESLSDQREGLH